MKELAYIEELKSWRAKEPCEAGLNIGEKHALDSSIDNWINTVITLWSGFAQLVLAVIL